MSEQIRKTTSINVTSIQNNPKGPIISYEAIVKGANNTGASQSVVEAQVAKAVENAVKVNSNQIRQLKEKVTSAQQAYNGSLSMSNPVITSGMANKLKKAKNELQAAEAASPQEQQGGRRRRRRGVSYRKKRCGTMRKRSQRRRR